MIRPRCPFWLTLGLLLWAQTGLRGRLEGPQRGNPAEAGYPGPDGQEDLEGLWGHRMELWLPGRGCDGGGVGADGEQAAGPSTGETVCSKKLNESSSQSQRLDPLGSGKEGCGVL